MLYTSTLGTTTLNAKFFGSSSATVAVGESSWTDVDFLWSLRMFAEAYVVTKTPTEKLALEFGEKWRRAGDSERERPYEQRIGIIRRYILVKELRKKMAELLFPVGKLGFELKAPELMYKSLPAKLIVGMTSKRLAHKRLIDTAWALYLLYQSSSQCHCRMPSFWWL